MTELDQVWSQMLNNAEKRAVESGRHSVADYLRLKAANDAVRELGTGWLFDTLIEIANCAVRDGVNLTIEREAPHSFASGASNMVGSLLSVRQGVRCLNIEAGWARTPSDGIMRNGALAFARIMHFGIPNQNSHLRLLQADTLPKWLDENNELVDTGTIQGHFDLFLDR